ncbi:MAG: hypothetical protein WCO30_00125 [bacterium]
MNFSFKNKLETLLPSKHFLNITVSLVFITALILTSYYLSESRSASLSKNKQIQNVEKNLKNIELKNEISNGDISSANLKNWENSGQTVQILSTIKTNTATNTEPIDLTGKMGRDLITSYMNAKSTGATFSEEDKQKLAEAIASRDYSSLFDFTYKDYTAKDLHISPNSLTKDVVDKYLADFSKSFTDNKLKQQVDDLGIIEEAFSKEDGRNLSKLDPLINMYKNISTDLKNMTVPKNVVELHLVVANSLKRAGEDLNYFKTKFNDPLVAMQAIQNYHISLQTYQNGLTAMFGGKSSQ